MRLRPRDMCLFQRILALRLDLGRAAAPRADAPRDAIDDLSIADRGPALASSLRRRKGSRRAFNFSNPKRPDTCKGVLWAPGSSGQSSLDPGMLGNRRPD